MAMDALRGFAIYGFQHLRSALEAWSPLCEEDMESDRAGRAGELQVAELFRGVSHVLVFQSLRIPDASRRGKREIDLVFLTPKKLYVIEVKNWSGSIRLRSDGSWIQIRRDGSELPLPDVVEDTKYRAELLEAYIARRGVILPPNFIQYRVFLVNPQCIPDAGILHQPEVLTSDQWQTFLDEDLDRASSSWLSNLLLSLTKEKRGHASFHEQLRFILSTAPTWDRLQLEGGKIYVGDFLRFNGRDEDMQALRSVKRSHVSHIEMSHDRSLLWNVLSLLVGICPAVKLVCTSRNVREAGGMLKKRHKQNLVLETKVRPDVEVVFRVVGTNQSQSFKVNNTLSLTLSL